MFPIRIWWNTGANRQPGTIGLYGLAYYTSSLIDLCRDAGIRVAFVVDDRTVPGRTGPDNPHACAAADAATQHDIPLWNASQFRWAVRLRRVRVPVLSAAIENSSGGSLKDDAFHIATRQVAALVGKRFRLWHPVTLSNIVELPSYRGSCALFGYPGSGNMLAQNLLHQLLERIPDPVPWQRQFVSVLAEHYFISTTQLLRDRLEPLGLGAHEFNPTEFPTMTMSMSFADGSSALIHQIPSHRHLAFQVYHSHSTPSQGLVRECQRLRVPLFIIARHPFETILSNASKIQRPPTALINDQGWMHSMVSGMGCWNQRLLDSVDQVTVLRYEDLIARDTATVRRGAERLGLSVSDAEIASMYDRILNRDLVAQMPGHFHQGGSDKWRKHFDRWQRALFKGYQQEAYFQRLGYEGLEDITEDEVRACAPPELSAWEQEYQWKVRQGLAANPEWNCSARDRNAVDAEQRAGALTVTFDLRPGWYQQPIQSVTRMLIQSDSRPVLRAIADLLAGEAFNSLLSAGGIGSGNLPWQPAIDWTPYRIFQNDTPWRSAA